MSTADATRAIAREYLMRLANFAAGEWRHEGASPEECEFSRIVSIEGNTVNYAPLPNPDAWVALSSPLAGQTAGRNRAERRRATRR